MLHTFASYKPGSFSIDVSNLSFDPVTEFIEIKDRPALVHEYCHFIQDITTISSIFGFSLWMRDVVALTGIFSSGIGVTIKVPLDRDVHNEPINKYRKLYSLYCGEAAEVFELDFDSLELKATYTESKEVSIDGRKVVIAVNRIEVDHPSRSIHFGLIALQEMHAYYAQLMAEERHAGVSFTVEATSLASFPYKFGDFLFRSYEITIDLPGKYILIDLCLDTIQAPAVFLEVLKALKGMTITSFGPSRTDLTSIVDSVNEKLSHGNTEAYNQIIPDLRAWANEPNRQYLSNALNWYINKIELVKKFKEQTSRTFFSFPFCMGQKDFALLYTLFPPPVYFNNGAFYRNRSIDEQQDHDFEKEFEAGSTIWSHRILYDLLCSESKERFQKHATCPLYDECETREKIDEDYTCRTAPWEIIKNEKSILCYYGMAAHSFGLWQNSLDIEF